LLGQVALFKAGLRGRTPSKQALYAIVTGANDYRDDDFNRPMSPVDVVGNIVTAVRSLHKLGGRNILVLTLPNLGCTPSVNPPGQPSVCDEAAAPPANGIPASLSELSALHNWLLATELATANLGPGVKLVEVNDAFSGLRGLAGPFWPLPALDTFTYTAPHPFPMSACLFIPGTPCQDVPTEPTDPFGPGAVVSTPWSPAVPLLFWDIVHPTTSAHEYLANRMYEQLRR
jgi:hypothetical protein